MAVEKVSRSVEWTRFAIELHVLREILVMGHEM